MIYKAIKKVLSFENQTAKSLTRKMTLDELKNSFGSFYKAARFLKNSEQSTMNWKRLGYIPIASQMKIEKLTGGELKARFEDCSDNE